MVKPKGKLPKKPPSFAEDAAGIQRLLGILGYTHLRARVVRDAILVESGPTEDPHVRLRFRPLPREDWRVDVRTHTGRWEPIPFVGPRGNMVAWIHQDFPWLLAADSQAG
jgi:hypothetical protein